MRKVIAIGESVLDTTFSDQRVKAELMTRQINEFLRYHIQDNSLFIGAYNLAKNSSDADGDKNSTEYETALIDKDTKTFFKLKVTTDESGSNITITDKAGNTRKVMTEKAGLFNLMAREYTYQGKDKSKASIIHNSSSAVIHLIDGPLLTGNTLNE